VKDLDTLRQALWETEYPAKAGDDLDIAAIMKRGRGMRLRRRLAAVGGTLCVAAAVYGVVAGTTHLTRPTPGPVRPAGPARVLPAVPSPARTVPKPTRAGPSPWPSPTGSSPRPTALPQSATRSP
jgi:hypothetical protein